MIQIQHLTKVYQTPSHRVLALDDISLEVQCGEIFGIIGLSGAGKSTLIRCINMLENPTQGTIVVNGQEITALKHSDLRQARQKIGMIFQQFNLLSSRTVFDNIMFPLEITGVPKLKARQRVTELLDLVQLSDKAKVYPNQLSGGQKQRVGIARALANDPILLLSDESTSALDPQTTSSILNLLKDINRQLKLTILLITHDMSVIKEICDRVAVIDNSRIVEIGDALDIFSRPGTDTSRSFIKNLVDKEIPAELLHRSPTAPGSSGSQLIKLSFIGSAAGEPVLSGMLRRFPVDANILYGHVDRIRDTAFGNLTVELIGESSNIEAAVTYLRERGLEVEVLQYV